MVTHKSRRKSRRAKRGIYVSFKCKEPIHYRSNWELEYAKYLDKNQDVISYSYEPYFILYVSNTKSKKIRKYYPDFELNMSDGSKLLVEIKPKNKLTSKINMKKFAAAIAMCNQAGITFRILTEVDLKSLGLLK